MGRITDYLLDKILPSYRPFYTSRTVGEDIRNLGETMVDKINEGYKSLEYRLLLSIKPFDKK